ncbi:amidohydrolase family protein [Chloroflexota bacterium]
MKKIAIEEHFYTEGYLDFLRSNKGYPRLEVVENEEHQSIWRWYDSSDSYKVWNPHLMRAPIDIGEGRLKEMDTAGIDMQVLSLAKPGVEEFNAVDGTEVAKLSNNELSQVIQKYPGRFAGLAALATQDPAAAANELERAVKGLGLKGANINSHVKGEYLDDEKYWVIFETAEKLGVPIYLHPKEPPQGMLESYLTYPRLASSMWGFAADAGLHAMRLILSGVFDKYPALKIVLGHMGEALPYWLWRMDKSWARGRVTTGALNVKMQKVPSQYVKDNFLVTTSGMFWEPAFLCAYLGLGADKILFAVDYPFESSKEAVQFMDSVSICDTDREKIYHLNAEKLLSL